MKTNAPIKFFLTCKAPKPLKTPNLALMSKYLHLRMQILGSYFGVFMK